MKVLFLDIDGVLNSARYDAFRHSDGYFPFVDESRLPLLKRIVDATGAKIVLSSTWRDCWDADRSRCDGDGRYLTDVFAMYGLTIYGKTDITENYYDRPDEIRAWLGAHPDVDSFAVADDDSFGWGDMESRVVVTNPRGGYGLEEVHAGRIIRILTGVR